MLFDKLENQQKYYSIKHATNERWWLRKHLKRPSNYIICAYILYKTEIVKGDIYELGRKTEFKSDIELLDNIQSYIENFIHNYDYNYDDVFNARESYIQSFISFEITSYYINNSISEHPQKAFFDEVIKLIFFRTLSIKAYSDKQYELSYNLNSSTNQLYGKNAYLDADDTNTINYFVNAKKNKTPVQINSERIKSRIIPLAEKIIQEDIQNVLSKSNVADVVISLISPDPKKPFRAQRTLIKWINNEKRLLQSIEINNSKPSRDVINSVKSSIISKLQIHANEIKKDLNL